ncbi:MULTISPECIES: hypothetical protein [Halomonadaceae]|uniref:hypothetical protein n=1 Tax=Halomonadaceae TaxID=28256 RepID=UPI001C267B0C|nr:MULTISPECIES: hypothetical protein [Halomonas]
MGFDFAGLYTRIVPHERIEYAFGDRTAQVEFADGPQGVQIWLEVVTDDIERASECLKEKRCHRRDEIEPLPAGVEAFWISSPSNIIHLASGIWHLASGIWHLASAVKPA